MGQDTGDTKWRVASNWVGGRRVDTVGEDGVGRLKHLADNTPQKDHRLTKILNGWSG